MGKAMEDMTATAGEKLKQRYGSSPAAIFTFVASLARTNLECEVVARGGSLVAAARAPRYKPRNECIAPLLCVGGAHARALQAAGADLGGRQAWDQLVPEDHDTETTNVDAESGAVSPHGGSEPARPVPLLLRDPVALLLQLLLLAPPVAPHLDQADFTTLVRAVYGLAYYQVVCSFCAGTGAGGRLALAGGGGALGGAARVLLAALRGSDLFTEDGVPGAGEPAPTPDLQQLELQAQQLLLPYLRVAALLKHHLYGAELPDVQTARQEFVRLVYYLELVTESMEWSSFNTGTGVAAQSHGAALGWARALGGAAARAQLAVRRLVLALHVPWLGPALLTLPREYERIFSYYHERVCLQCGAVPKEASLCLLCGTLVCLKQPCCRHHHVAEAVQHARDCGGGTGIFLVVTSTYIIVIRGRRACLWGSLYLDDYDEEDRDLKRGKPLYLSQDRLELLQDQWLHHRFDHTKRTWVWHRDSL